MGYAFINFTTHANAVAFMGEFKGLRLPALRSNKVCDVSWARIQSLEDNVEHYRNNPINSLPDSDFRPLIFRQGVPADFPRPDRVNVRAIPRRPHIVDIYQTYSDHRSNLIPMEKIFVGGLSAETESLEVREYFSQFGTITDCAIVRDRKTSCSRGFAFCCFSEVDAVNKVLAQRQHIIRGQSVGVRRYSIKK